MKTLTHTNGTSAQTKQLAQAEILISWVLRIGVLSCGSIIAVGLLSRLFAIGGPEQVSSRELISSLLGGQATSFQPISSPAQVLSGVLSWHPDVVMTAGLLLLIALPIFRVALTVFVFLHERDWPFVAITVLVLTVLLSGIFLGHAL